MNIQARPLPRIFVFCSSGDCSDSSDWHSFQALSEDGEFLAAHICSSHDYALHDMGVRETGLKRELYVERYSNGFDVVLVTGPPKQHAELMAAYANHVAHGKDGSPWQQERARSKTGDAG